MSHFTLLVIGDNVDQQLAPYADQEFEDQYAVFENKEDEYRNEYENETIEAVIVDGEFHTKYDDIFRKKTASIGSDWVYPKNAVFKKMLYKEFYPTMEDFLSQWHGVHSVDEKTGLYGYWTNPNGKWDWYSIGGRWTGYFLPKDGASGNLGRSGAFDNSPRKGWVDQIRLGDIDFEAMRADAEQAANDVYDTIENIVQGRQIPSWTAIIKKHGDNIEAARNEYNNHPVIKSFHESDFQWFGIDLEGEYGQGREAYVAKCRNRVAVTYAVLKDGEWFQKGEMGMFGDSHGEMTQDSWNEQFCRLIDSLSPDTVLTLVDCHI